MHIYSGDVHLVFNGEITATLSKNNSSSGSAKNFIMIGGDNFQIEFGNNNLINIFEYSASSSGAYQGMDFIVP